MASRTVLPSVTTKTAPGPAPNGMGNGLFATADMNPGDTVLHIEAPFVAILDSPRLEDTCAGCFGKRQVETGSELKACTGCRVVKYCDRVSRFDDRTVVINVNVNRVDIARQSSSLCLIANMNIRHVNPKIGNLLIPLNVQFSKISSRWCFPTMLVLFCVLSYGLLATSMILKSSRSLMILKLTSMKSQRVRASLIESL